MTDPTVTAIVLAGGRSRRFGRDKLIEPISGRPLLEHAIQGVGAVADETIVVAAADETRIVPGGVILVADSTSFEGPLVGLLTGLRRASHPIAVVVGGDMPTLVPYVLSALVDRLLDPSLAAAILECGGVGRPLPGALRVAVALPAAEGLVEAGERRLRALYEAISTDVIAEPTWRELDPDGRTLRDIDTPGDLVR
ncbi:MAG: molybdenum cofactor guanylyltransferase [Chloroflexi bacterium]|nr:molybdenum cofactor guanylyltransferase [Chloroflexota bacterium]